MLVLSTHDYSVQPVCSTFLMLMPEENIRLDLHTYIRLRSSWLSIIQRSLDILLEICSYYLEL